MPIRYREDDTPVVEFDPRLEVSPFTLFRRLRERQPVLLIDVRSTAGGPTLRGARALPGPGWSPPDDLEVVLFDDDGRAAVTLARELQGRGFDRVRALFGGLELYSFALDPEVVGRETFLVAPPAS